jgi:hypothetical protein
LTHPQPYSFLHQFHWHTHNLIRSSTSSIDTPGFKDKLKCINTCAPGSSYTHASTQRIQKQCQNVKEVLKLYYMTDSLYSNTLSNW